MSELSISPSSLLHTSWDPQTIEILNSPDMSFVMDLPLLSENSSGYLEDALIHYGEMSKRRRLLFSTTNDHQSTFNDLVKSYWKPNSINRELSENFSCMTQMTNIYGVSDEERSKENEAIMSVHPEALESSSTSSYECSDHITNSVFQLHPQLSINPVSYSGTTSNEDDNEDDKNDDVKETIKMNAKTKKRVTGRVVYPFALVKPGGKEGEVTLNEINERIVMPSRRALRHPVGKFACRPCVSAAHGPGLSGKAVVALTRIHTQGKGTITIIRTKG